MALNRALIDRMRQPIELQAQLSNISRFLAKKYSLCYLFLKFISYLPLLTTET